jgi:hypothetical protein
MPLQWETGAMDAMGWVTGFDDHADGTLVCWCDTYGAYIANAAKTAWEPLVVASELPATGLPIHHGIDNWGIYAVAIAPSNSSVLWMVNQVGKVFRSATKGKAWASIAFDDAPNADDFNSNYNFNKLARHKMKVDPSNAEVVYLTGRIGHATKGGLWRKLGSTQNFKSCNLPLPIGRTGSQQGTSGIVIDNFTAGQVSTGGVTGSQRKAKVYAHVFGRGYYKSGDGGDTWTAIAGGPVTSEVYDACLVNADTLLCVEYGSSTKLWKLVISTGVWTNLTASAQLAEIRNRTLHYISVDPFNANRWLLVAQGGDWALTTDAGANWIDHVWPPGRLRQFVNGDVPLMGARTPSDPNNVYWMSLGGTGFVKYQQDRVLCPNGIGVYTLDLPGTTIPTTMVFNSFSKGIIQLVVQHMTEDYNGKLWGLCHDAALVPVDRPRVQPSVYFGNRGAAIRHGQYMGLSTADKDLLAITSVFQEGSQPGGTEYSTNGGQTWNLLNSYPTLRSYDSPTVWSESGGFGNGGGNFHPVKMGGSGLIALWEPCAQRHPVRTADGGTTWTEMNFPGISKNYTGNGMDTKNFRGDYTTRKVAFAQDPANPDRIFWWHWLGGIAESTDAGATWALYPVNINGAPAPSTRPPCNWASYHGKLMFTPRIAGLTNRDGHMWMGSGDIGPDTAYQTDGFFRTTNYGRDWSVIPDVWEVKCFAFGKNKPGVDYPALVIAGFVNGVMGVYLCENPGAATLEWKQLDAGPVNNSLDIFHSITMSYARYLKISVAFNGSGFAFTFGQAAGYDRMVAKKAA